jgi:hypothetical protein
MQITILLFIVTHCKFRPNWASSSVQVLFVRELRFVFSSVAAAGLLVLVTCCSHIRATFTHNNKLSCILITVLFILPYFLRYYIPFLCVDFSLVRRAVFLAELFMFVAAEPHSPPVILVIHGNFSVKILRFSPREVWCCFCFLVLDRCTWCNRMLQCSLIYTKYCFDVSSVGVLFRRPWLMFQYAGWEIYPYF